MARRGVEESSLSGNLQENREPSCSADFRSYLCSLFRRLVSGRLTGRVFQQTSFEGRAPVSHNSEALHFVSSKVSRLFPSIESLKHFEIHGRSSFAYITLFQALERLPASNNRTSTLSRQRRSINRFNRPRKTDETSACKEDVSKSRRAMTFL